jgi:Glycosyl hydrolases family 31
MRVAILLIALSAAHAGVISRDWADGKLTLHLNDGIEEIEWISEKAFHLSRGAASLPAMPKIKHDPVLSAFEDTRESLILRGRYVSIEIEKATAKLRVHANSELVGSLSIDPSTDGQALQISSIGKTFGLDGPGASRQFFFTQGYGIFIRLPHDCSFDLKNGLVLAPRSSSMDLTFYYGPTPKEVFEQHQIVTGKTEVTAESLRILPPNLVPSPASLLGDTVVDSWEGLSQLVLTIWRWSLSGVMYPAVNLATFRASRGELARREEDLASMLPIIYGNPKAINPALREIWTPYLTTYLREAYDRGYPLIRPLPVQFSRDANLDPQPGVFMLGDEVLLAPMVAAGPRRELRVPRGVWTDLRTNAVYKGNQSIEVEAPPGQVPTFVRNGALLPLATKREMELHYFPSLGGEFFLWEPEKNDNSQFHAAPAGDFTRLEIETLVTRTYEWIVHHTAKPSNVEEGGIAYTPVRQRSLLKPGNWWFDESRENLHIMVYAEGRTDKIVNMSF